MTDLDLSLFQAWNRVAPMLLSNPEELQRRLARRQSKLFQRPLRAFCLAARASDHRLTDTFAIIDPPHALALDHPAHPGRCIEHRFTLDQRLLQLICQSVKIATPGEPADHVADKLGCGTAAIRSLRRRNILSTDLKPGLMGRHGPPVPLVYSPDYLDPQSHNRAGSDEIFACSWRRNYELVPDGFRQTITRIPRYTRVRGRHQFRGWYWICPCCRKSAESIYYSVDQPDFPTLMDFAPALSAPLPKPTPIFACRRCHGVLGFSRVNLAQKWNILILRITGGLMFGHEVQKPAWLTPQRKRAYRPIAPRPAPRRDLVQRLLVDTTLTGPQIAAQIGMSLRRVRNHADAIYKRHHVHTRQELQRLLRPPQPLPTARAG